MLTYEEIMDYCSNYKIEKGIVIDKKSNQEIVDEDIILKVRASILLFQDAKETYQFHIRLLGKTNKTKEDYVKITMEKFSVSNEKNNYGINKLINSILSSNGHYEEDMSGSDLQDSKFSILVSPKKEYGIAYLKLKFREKGLDIEDLKISQDFTELQKNGLSKVIIDFKIKKYDKTKQNIYNKDTPNEFHHPRSNELNDLEKQKQIAKQNNDEIAFNYAQSAIEKIIRESRVEVNIDQWNSMSLSQQISFVEIKLNEAKTLHDEDEIKYWTSNLESLKRKLNEKLQKIESSSGILKYNSQNTVSINEIQVTAHQTEQNNEKKDYRFYYDEMMKAVKKYIPDQKLTEKQKKQIIGEIFYNEGYMIERLSNDEEIRQIINLVVNELNGNAMQIKLLNIILSEVQEKYQQLNLQNKIDTKPEIIEKNSESNSNELDLSNLIEQLKVEWYKIQSAYNFMFSEGYIDDKELAVLIKMINTAIQNGYSLKTLAVNQNDVKMVSQIIDLLEEAQKKMNKMQIGIEEIGISMK